jgi:branched-chain amino acid transport system substrate-binding protein
MKKMIGLFVILMWSLSISAWGQEKQLKIGLVAPMTGAGAPWGLAWKRSAQLIAEQINSAGGLTVQGQKYKIELIAEDDKYSPSEAVTVTNKLIFNDKVSFILGPIGSALCTAISPITEDNKVITFHSCQSPKSLGPDRPFAFRAVPLIGENVPPMFRWIKEKYPNVKKMAVLSPNDETGWTVNAEYMYVGKKFGFETVAEDYFQRNTNDFYPVLTRILKNQPDLLAMSGGTGDIGLILKQARQMGYKGLAYSSAAHDPDKLCKVAGKEFAEGYLHSALTIMPGPIKKWHDEYVARWGEWSDVSILGTALDIIVQGIKKADSLDTTKVRKAIETMNYTDRLFGPLKFGGKKRYGLAHQLLEPIFITQIKDCSNVLLSLVPPVEPEPAPPMSKKN